MSARSILSIAVLAIAAAVAPAPVAQASWPGLNGLLSFSSNRFGTALSGDIFTMPSFGLPQTQLTEVRADDAQSAWSPDGRRIAFKSRRNGNNELYVMNADGSDETRLTNSFRVSEGQPFWSPDGTRLLYRKTPDNPIVRLEGFTTARRRRTRSTACSSTASTRSSRTRWAATTWRATSRSSGATRRSRCLSRSRARIAPRGA
jgi:dipeptidyl aminopeptidase/acylaminoacyl peptidase